MPSVLNPNLMDALFFFGFLKLVPTVLGKKVVRGHDVQPLQRCKLVCAAAAEQHVSGLVHDCPCCRDGVFHGGHHRIQAAAALFLHRITGFQTAFQ